MEANKGNLADRIRKQGVMERHEVPYASTLEGGKLAITFPSFSSQNGWQGHGGALNKFYQRNNFKGGKNLEFRYLLTKDLTPNLYLLLFLNHLLIG